MESRIKKLDHEYNCWQAILSTRNQNKSIIIVTNISFNRWNKVFADEVLTAAMVDRLTHKAHVLNITGESYRIKETKEWLTNN